MSFLKDYVTNIIRHWHLYVCMSTHVWKCEWASYHGGTNLLTSRRTGILCIHIQTWLMGVFFIRGIHYNLCFNLCLYQYFACKCQTLNLTLWNIRASLVNIKHWTILIIHDLTLHMINIISFCIFSVHLTSISLNQAITIVTIIIQINNIVWGCG